MINRTATTEVEIGWRHDPRRRRHHHLPGIGQPRRDALGEPRRLRHLPDAPATSGLRLRPPHVPGDAPGPPRDPGRRQRRARPPARTPARPRWRRPPHPRPDLPFPDVGARALRRLTAHRDGLRSARARDGARRAPPGASSPRRSGRAVSAARASCRWPSLVAPTMGAVTPGRCSNQANATWAGATPRSVGDLGHPVDDVEIGGLAVEVVGERVGARPGRPLLAVRGCGCRPGRPGPRGSTG